MSNTNQFSMKGYEGYKGYKHLCVSGYHYGLYYIFCFNKMTVDMTVYCLPTIVRTMIFVINYNTTQTEWHTLCDRNNGTSKYCICNKNHYNPVISMTLLKMFYFCWNYYLYWTLFLLCKTVFSCDFFLIVAILLWNTGHLHLFRPKKTLKWEKEELKTSFNIS